MITRPRLGAHILAVLVASTAALVCAQPASAQTPSILLASPPDPKAAVGQSFSLTYNWHGGTTSSLKAFVHFVDTAGQITFGDDHSPPTPTNQWSGDVSYTRTIPVPTNVRTGSYTVMAGLYNPATGDRSILNPGPSVITHPESRYQIASLTITPSIYMHYHAWYKTTGCPTSNPTVSWDHWAWEALGDNPCIFPQPATPWLRQISSPGYPLIGPYNSADPAVLGWHVQLAKAAGVDAFFVAVYKEEVASVFASMLNIASQHEFKLAIEAWRPEHGETTEGWQAKVRGYLDSFGDHPAYLRIDGKPALWFNNNFMDLAALTTFLASASSAYWIVVDNLSVPQLTNLNIDLSQTGSEVAQQSYYNQPSLDGWNTFSATLPSALAGMKNAGLLTVAHAYPGFNEKAISSPPPVGQERPFPPRFGLRNNGQTINEFLQAAVPNADVLLFESFNDWSEYTVFEPGFDIRPCKNMGQEAIFNGDPYRYLKLLAAFKVKPWVDQTPPVSVSGDLNCPPAPFCCKDFDGDGLADILWRDTSGTVALWRTNGPSPIVASVPTSWMIAGIGDFNHDGKADILWWDTVGGTVATWIMDGATITSSHVLGTVATSWAPAAVADFNGDGMADILWRNMSGAVAIWLVDDGATIIGSTVVNVSPDWTPVRVGDFNGDSRADILWRNTAGSLAMWLMNGTTIIGSPSLGTVSPNWTPDGIGDFNGDGRADILWRDVSGPVAIWLMNGANIIGTHSVAAVSGAWMVAGVGQFKGDNTPDILWRDGGGNMSIWQMNGAAIGSTHAAGNAPPPWAPQ